MRCESCVYNAADTHIGFSTCLIPAGMHYCFWGETKQAMTVGMKKMCQRPNGFMSST